MVASPRIVVASLVFGIVWLGGGGADDTAEACFEAESHSLLRHEPTAGEILKVMFCTTVLAIPKRFDTAFRHVG